MNNTLKIKRIRSARTRGFTLMELMIAAVISGMVMLSVLSIQYITARTINDVYNPTRSRSVRMNALNQIRFRLCDARVGSVEILDANHRIQFEDPNLSKAAGRVIRSEFFFDTAKRTLFFDEDVDNLNPFKVARGPINITFFKGTTALDPPDFKIYKNTDSVVTVLVETSHELSYSKVDLRDGETVVYLRNN